MRNLKWDSGTRYGRLMCTGKSYLGKASKRYVEVICDCGKIAFRRFDGIDFSENSSCGCYNIERVKENPCNIKHGLHNHPLWNVFRSLEYRCYQPSCNRFKNYGGKGVVVCDEWRHNYVAFYNWAINNGWEKGLQLDKDIKYKEKHGTDTGMIYSPEYCSFITCQKNNRNRTTSRFLEYKGQYKTMAEWAEIVGISQSTLNNRINKYGYSVEQTLTVPLKNKKSVIPLARI